MKGKHLQFPAALFFLVFAICACKVQSHEHTSSARKKSRATLRDYRKNPVWISMMSDSSANYFDVLLAYDEFWKKRPEPNVEEAFERKQNGGENKEEKEEEEEDKRSLLGKMFHSEEKENIESSQYMIEYKRFQTWKKDMLPYVQADGSMLTPSQRLEIYKNQRP